MRLCVVLARLRSPRHRSQEAPRLAEAVERQVQCAQADAPTRRAPRLASFARRRVARRRDAPALPRRPQAPPIGGRATRMRHRRRQDRGARGSRGRCRALTARPPERRSPSIRSRSSVRAPDRPARRSSPRRRTQRAPERQCDLVSCPNLLAPKGSVLLARSGIDRVSAHLMPPRGDTRQSEFEPVRPAVVWVCSREV